MAQRGSRACHTQRSSVKGLHFDSESIRSSSELLKRNKDVIVKLLSADCPDGATARKNLGRALHALQDFYSHTNWVELGFSSINRKLGREIFGLSTQEQSKLVVSSDGERLLPDVIFSLNENKLTSGYYPAVPTTPDPRSGIKIRHGEALVNNFTSPGLNKDGPSRTGFGEARRLAGLATIDFLNQIIDEIPEKNRVKGISSLMGLGQGVTFVVDTTGSMGDEIDGVIAKIAELVDDATSEIVLQTFNDPEVPAARKFCDVGEFLSALASISVSGGDDCPEQSNLGVYRAVAASGEKSKVYVFTDASNKSSLSRSAITSAAKAKKITIEFLLTGSCSPIDPDYYAIAQETGGNVYSLFEGGIGIEKISEGIKEDLTNKFQLITHISAINSGTERNIDIPVDSSITRLVLSAGSDGASVDFRSPGGAVIVPGPNVNIQIGESGDTILIIDRPAVGTWLSKITGNGPYSFSAKGVSDYKLVDVAYGKLQPSHHSEVEEFAVFSGDPPPSRPTITRFQFIGDLREVVTYLERSDGTQINSTTLPKIDYGGGMVGDVFFGTTTPPAEKFNFVVVGKNAASEPVQRQWPLQFSPSNISIEPVFPLFEVSRGTVRPIEFKVTNFGGAVALSLRVNLLLGP